MIELLQFISVLYLTGLIWTIQMVHYPGFTYVDEVEFSGFHRHHYRGISFAVIPAMLIEFATGVYLLFKEPTYGVEFHMLLVSILGIIWLSTFLIQVPIHRQLEKGKNMEKINVLVKTNWIRTIGWTSRAAVFSVLYGGGFT